MIRIPAAFAAASNSIPAFRDPGVPCIATNGVPSGVPHSSYHILRPSLRLTLWSIGEAGISGYLPWYESHPPNDCRFNRLKTHQTCAETIFDSMIETIQLTATPYRIMVPLSERSEPRNGAGEGER